MVVFLPVFDVAAVNTSPKRFMMERRAKRQHYQRLLGQNMSIGVEMCSNSSTMGEYTKYRQACQEEFHHLVATLSIFFHFSTSSKKRGIDDPPKRDRISPGVLDVYRNSTNLTFTKERAMFKKLAVGLQVICLCVVVSFFAVEAVNNTTQNMVGGWCIGDPGAPSGGVTNPPCHSSSGQSCPGTAGCPLRFSSCNGGAGGGGGCTNTASPACNTDSRCTSRTACTCSVNAYT